MSGGLLRLVVGGALACATVWPVAAWAQASAPIVAPVTSATAPATAINVPPSPADAGGKTRPMEFGGTAPYAWADTAGALPPGIRLTNDALTGAPTQAAPAGAAGVVPSLTHRFQMTVADQTPVAKGRWFSILVR